MERSRDLLGYLLPKTVVGLALWLLIFAVGVGASGVVFFVIYERRGTELDARMGAGGPPLGGNIDTVDAQRKIVERATAGGAGAAGGGPVGEITKLLTAVGPSVAVVQGIDASGARTSGSGFVLSSTSTQSWVL